MAPALNIGHFWYLSGQITIIPKPQLRGFGGDSLTKPPFGVTSAEVVIICPDLCEISGGVSIGAHIPF